VSVVIDDPKRCGIGEGERCCAFLTMGQGWNCGRTESSIAATIRLRLMQGTMNAKYDPGNLDFPECQNQRTEETP